jgi:hypothetical protein
MNLQVPAVDNGVIPRNEYGNIEVWEGDPRLVPQGAALVTLPHAAKCATTLGIQHVPALFGFEQRGMSKYPVIGGVVVLQTDESLLIEAAVSFAEEREDRLIAKREAIILKRWENLVRAAVLREELRIRYGH